MLGPYARGVRFNPTPDDDRSTDEVVGHGRRSARTRIVIGVDAARAPGGGRRGRIVVAGGAARGHLRRRPRRHAEHRSQLCVDQAPMAKPGDRLDQVRRELHPGQHRREPASRRAPAALPTCPLGRHTRPGALAGEHAVKPRQGPEQSGRPGRIDPILEAADPDPPFLELGDCGDQVSQRAAETIQAAHDQAVTPVTQMRQCALELPPLTPRPRIGEPPLAARGAQCIELLLQTVAVLAADVRVSDQHPRIVARHRALR